MFAEAQQFYRIDRSEESHYDFEDSADSAFRAAAFTVQFHHSQLLEFPAKFGVIAQAKYFQHARSPLPALLLSPKSKKAHHEFLCLAEPVPAYELHSANHA